MSEMLIDIVRATQTEAERHLRKLCPPDDERGAVYAIFPKLKQIQYYQGYRIGGVQADDAIEVIDCAITQVLGFRTREMDYSSTWKREGKKREWVVQIRGKSKKSNLAHLAVYIKGDYIRVEVIFKNPPLSFYGSRERILSGFERLKQEAEELLTKVGKNIRFPEIQIPTGKLMSVFKSLGFQNPEDSKSFIEAVNQLARTGVYDVRAAREAGHGLSPTQVRKLCDLGFWKGSEAFAFKGQHANRTLYRLNPDFEKSVKAYKNRPKKRRRTAISDTALENLIEIKARAIVDEMIKKKYAI